MRRITPAISSSTPTADYTTYVLAAVVDDTPSENVTRWCWLLERMPAAGRAAASEGNFSQAESTVPTPVLVLRATGDYVVSVRALLNDGSWTEQGRLTITENAELREAEAAQAPLGSRFRGYYVDGAERHYYVDATFGSVNNTGLSPTSALPSLDAVRSKYPLDMGGGSRAVVHFAGVGASAGLGFTAPTGRATYRIDRIDLMSPAVVGNKVAYRGSPMVRATLATGPATAALDAVPAVRCNALGANDGAGRFTRLDFATAAPGWTVHDLRAKALHVRLTRAGSLVVFELPVFDNDADGLWVEYVGLVGTVLNTDTAEIVEPSALLRGLDAWSGGYPLLVYGYASPLPTVAELGHTFERLAFDTLWVQAEGVSWDRCQFLSQGDSALFERGSNGLVNCAAACKVYWFSNSPIGPAPTSRPDSASSPIDTTPSVECMYQHGLDIGAQQAPGNYVAKGNIGVNAADESGIVVTGPGSYFTQSQDADLAGRDNAYGGLACQEGGCATIRGGVYTEARGAGGALLIDTYVEYGTGAGQFEEAVGFNGLVHRVGGSTATVPRGDFSLIRKGA